MTPELFAERSLLGVLVRDPDRMSEVGPQLDGWDFNGPRERGLFTVLREHHWRVGQHARTVGRYQPDEWAQALLAAWPELARYDVDAAYLTEVMALAPSGGGQPDVYAELVLEASIRRQITALGYEAARLSAQIPQVAELLAAQESITAQLASAQQRWDAITQTRDVRRTLGTDPAVGGNLDLDLFGRPVLPAPATPGPSGEEVHAAQEQVIGAILRHPGVADALLGRLEPADFLDQELGNALDAAQQVHAQATVTGRQVDPVTVAWTLQTLPDDRGPTPPPEYLHELAATEPNDIDNSVDLVMRASLAKVTAQAAATAQQAAGQTAVAPAEVLAAARTAYQAVDAAARRLTGRSSTDYQLGVLDNRATTYGSPTTADLGDLRSRSTTLLQQTTAGRSGPDLTGSPGIGARLDALGSPTAGQEVYPDAGPSPA